MSHPTDLRFRVFLGEVAFTFELDRIEDDEREGDETHLERAYKFLNEDVRAGVPVYDDRGNAWILTPDTRIDALELLGAAG